MNRFYCEKEREILEALRGGSLSAELANHATSCAICADTLAVSEFLLADRTSAIIQDDPSERSAPFAPRMDLRGEEPWKVCARLPDSDFLWWKAQLARKRLAVERATRSIAVVRRVSYLGAAAAGLWLVFSPGPLGSILSALSKREIWPAGALAQSALFMGIAALVFTLLGSLYLARPEK